MKIKWHLSKNLKFQNLFQVRKLLPVSSFVNILLFDREYGRKLLILKSEGSFIKNCNIYLTLCMFFLNETFSIFKIISLRFYGFSVAIDTLS